MRPWRRCVERIQRRSIDCCVLWLLSVYFTRPGNKGFSLTPLGVCLTNDARGSRHNYARWISPPASGGPGGIYSTASNREKARPDLRMGWMPGPIACITLEEQAVFNSAMTDISRSDAQSALEAYDFNRFGCVVDVGGGQGLLLKEILLACPATRGILFD